MTALVGIHHLGLTVTDVERSAAWYQQVLGFVRVGEFGGPHDPRRKVFLRHPALAARLGLVQHATTQHDRFDETTVGLDHLAFAVGDDAELDEWAERLAAAGVPYSPPAGAHTLPATRVIVLRDPDNIQLELVSSPTEQPEPEEEAGSRG